MGKPDIERSTVYVWAVHLKIMVKVIKNDPNDNCQFLSVQHVHVQDTSQRTLYYLFNTQ
jgi:hypothetical protein